MKRTEMRTLGIVGIIAGAVLVAACSRSEFLRETEYLTNPPTVSYEMEACLPPSPEPGLLYSGEEVFPIPPPRQASASAASAGASGSVTADGRMPMKDADKRKPIRTIHDPYPVFAGLAVDPKNNKVVVADQNTFNLLVYDRNIDAKGLIKPYRAVGGQNTKMLFTAGVDVDPETQEMYTVNNDIMDNVVIFNYWQEGNVKPIREFSVDHGSWGLSIDKPNNEIAVTTQHTNKLAIYPANASGKVPALRIVQGPNTGMADPHGVFTDNKNNEIFVSNHGHWHRVEAPRQDQAAPRGEDAGANRPPPTLAPLRASTGRFIGPSITVYERTAKGDAAPVRTIQGDKTGLNLPLSMFVDTVRNEIFVANDGKDSVLVFDRKANGNVAPLRTISGSATGLKNPAGISLDMVNNHIWVANWGNRSITVYPRDAKGNAAPLTTFKAAPAEEPMAGLGNNGAIAFNPVRDELLIPNCVAHPRIAVFDRMANGNAAPLRYLDGQGTNIARTTHGISIDTKRKEMVIPNPFAEAILFYPWDAEGEHPPKRTIQGPKTMLVGPQAIALDEVNGEVYVPSQRSILVFPADGSGDIAPTRILRGPTTKLTTPFRVAVDPKNNIMVVVNDNNPPALAIFERTANGDMAPKAFITGPNTGIVRAQYVQVDPERKLIFAALSDVNPRYQNYTTRDEHIGIGIWGYDDNGDVPPRFAIRGGEVKLGRPRALDINPKEKELYVTDMKNNAVFTYYLPEVFK